MKSKILDRPMFKKPIDETDVENVGIMQGFMDEDDDLDYAEYMKEEEPDEDSDMAGIMDRRPNSPEILMNNLRGDMRSIDARVEELADLVGYNAAAETPQDVLALLQPVFAAQQAPAMPQAMPPQAMPQGGIPQEAMPAEMMGGMPQEMPPEMMGGIGALPADQGPGMAEPVMMAKGGPVQYFRDGTDEDGVTPDDNTSSFAGVFPNEVVQQARAQMLADMKRQPTALPNLEAEVDKRSPLYEKLMGVDNNLSQAQILFELGQRAFNFGANVDDQGRPLRGSAAARLAGAVRTLPGSIGQITGQMDQQRRAVRGAALQASEKGIQNILENNARLAETQRKTATDLAKAPPSIFSKGQFAQTIVNTPGLMNRYAKNQITEQEANLIDTAITEYKEPKPMQVTDPVTGNISTVFVPGKLPEFVEKADASHRALTGKGPSVPQTAPSASGSSQDKPEKMTAAQFEKLQRDAENGDLEAQRFLTQYDSLSDRAKNTYSNQTDPLKVEPDLQNYYSKPSVKPTLFNQATGTGVFSGLSSMLFRTPVIGGLMPSSVEAASLQKKNLENVGLQISKGIAENPRFAEGERKYIQSTLDLLPSTLDRPEAYIQRVFALDSYLLNIQRDELQKAFNENLPAKSRQEARAKAADIDVTRQNIGVPIRINNKNDPRISRLPSGTQYLYQDKYIYSID